DRSRAILHPHVLFAPHSSPASGAARDHRWRPRRWLFPLFARAIERARRVTDLCELLTLELVLLPPQRLLRSGVGDATLAAHLVRGRRGAVLSCLARVPVAGDPSAGPPLGGDRDRRRWAA